MTVTADLEQPRELAEGQSDAVTVAFSDAEADVCGLARVGRSRSDGQVLASGLALLFAGGKPVAAAALGGEPAGGSWEETRAAGVRTEVVKPLESWRIAFQSEDSRHGFDLELRALSAPAETDPGSKAAKVGGMAGYDQLVAVRGEVTVDGRKRRFEGRGTRGRSWGAPDWDRLSLARTISGWLEGDTGLTITAVRPAKAKSHADEAIHAVLLEGADGDGSKAVPVPVAEPRISTIYDAEGRQRSVGLELFRSKDSEWAERAAAEVACGTTLDLGRLRLDCAFVRWHMEGRTGVGRYDILRRVDR